jgi:hypothetical protein
MTKLVSKKDFVAFIVGVMVGLVIVLFGLKAEKDSNMILNLRTKTIFLEDRIVEMEKFKNEITIENENLKYTLNQCRILYKGM